MSKPVIPLAEMKDRIRLVLLPGRSLEREAIKDAVFASGGYSYENHTTFDNALDAMIRTGELRAHGSFGPFQRVDGAAAAELQARESRPTSPPAARSKVPGRPRSAERM